MGTVSDTSEQNEGRRRLDRIQAEGYGDDVTALPIDDLRERREDCLAEREFLSYLRRLLQGRLEILRDEQERRASGAGPDERPIEERLAAIFAQETSQGSSRGEHLVVELPEAEMTNARRRLEVVMSEAAFSDPGAMSDDALASVISSLEAEEREVSDLRRIVMDLHDVFRDEFKVRMRAQVQEQGISG